MTTTHLLQQLGIYIAPHFLTQSECNTLCQEMMSSPTSEAATYRESDKREKVDHAVRQTLYCHISNELHHLITTKISQIRPALETFFQSSLHDAFEHPKYLHYREGDFFSPHTDNQLNRKINITINLNDQDSEHSFEGGDLQLYGLLTKGAFKNRGIAAPNHAGCLIAYPVDIVHEITPILSGSRFAIVSRFLSAGHS